MIRAALMGLVLAGLVGCTSKPVLMPKEVLVAGPSYSDQEIQQAILQAAALRGWSARQVAPGLIQADITVRNTFYAAVDIRYSRNDFSIGYRDSRGLDHKDGKIHRNYNRWVHALDKNILRELKRIETNRMVQRAMSEQNPSNAQ